MQIRSKLYTLAYYDSHTTLRQKMSNLKIKVLFKLKGALYNVSVYVGFYQSIHKNLCARISVGGNSFA